ncbi:vanin-like protein 1 [Choristoneura fumiferana]|uniref:vanin-like protein 1 n=1 Tax=Choristoneura fumiferana TaxID=7141 RepID=UPI003D1589C5
MKVLVNIVVLCLYVGLTMSTTDTYKAGVVTRDTASIDAYAPTIRDAAKSNVDILVLPPPSMSEISKSSTEPDNYDTIVKTISAAAKEYSIYVVSHLIEKIRCQEKTELIRSNLVFNRQGTIISVYRKPQDSAAKCNVTATEIGSFITDFGVTFGVLMPEDLVLQNLEELKDVRNFVLTGNWRSEIPVLAPPQFFTTWAYTTGANLVSTSGVFAGKAGRSGSDADVVLAELKKDGEVSMAHPTTAIKTSYSDDLSQYTIKPLDLVASSRGVQETVCHGHFCCRFYVKTTSDGSPNSVNYGLAAFEGIQHYGGQHNIGTQNCALLPCVGNYKRTCDVGLVNSTTIIFDEIRITGNFKLRNSAQYPVIISTDTVSSNQFKFTKRTFNKTSQVSIKLNEAQKLLNFGIFGRDFSKDHVSDANNYDSDNGLTYNITDYISSDNVVELFDYLWIKLRIPIFIVSIYVLEMM